MCEAHMIVPLPIKKRNMSEALQVLSAVLPKYVTYI